MVKSKNKSNMNEIISPSFVSGNRKIKGRYRIYDKQRKENDLKNELILQKTYYDKLFNISDEAIVFFDERW